MEEKPMRSEARYRLLFNNISDAILVHEFHDDGSVEPIVEVNEVACQLLEYTREELLGMGIQELTPPEAQAVDPLAGRFRSEGHLVYESIYVSKSGRKFPVEISNRLFELDGKPMIFATVRDITEGKQAKLVLTEEAIRHRILFEEAKDGIVVIGQDLNVVEANRSFVNMLGYSPEEVRQLHVWDWDVFFPTEKLLRQRWSEPPTARSTFESRHRRKDGSVYDVEVSSNPALFPDGAQIYCVCRDITGRKQLEENLARKVQIEREKIIRDLESALGTVKTLSGLLPICASCKKIRDEIGQWVEVEVYVRNHSEADFSHGICPECAAKLYPDLLSGASEKPK
jgi:PAS domain S-box-containing protein